MVPNRRGSRFVWFCGVSALVVLAVAAVSWQNLLVRYHLQRLRRDPAALLAFLEAPKGTVKNFALQEFAREAAGKQAVVSRFLSYVAKARSETAAHRRALNRSTWWPWLSEKLNARLDSAREGTGAGRALGDVDNGIVGFRGEWSQIPGSLAFWAELRWGGAFQNSNLVLLDDGNIVPLAELLVECRGAMLDLPEYPGLTVEVLSLESGCDRAKRWKKPLDGAWCPPDKADYKLIGLDKNTPASQDSVLLLSRAVRD